MAEVMRYIEAIRMVPSSFKSLIGIDYRCNGSDEPFYFASSRSILLKVKYSGKYRALKCFTNPSEYISKRNNALNKYINKNALTFISKAELYQDEIGLIENGKIVRYPILLSDWIEGELLSERIEYLCCREDRDAIKDLRDLIINIFIELLGTDLSHGDLKFDNIIISPKNEIFIIDWDGCYLPELENCATKEIGTINYQHPNRLISDFGKGIDDYSISIIVLTMIILSEQPVLFYGDKERDYLLFSTKDIYSGDSRLMDKLFNTWQYYPLRIKLLSFISGSDIAMVDLRDTLIRLVGNAELDIEIHEVIDCDTITVLRRIINRSTNLYGFVNSKERIVIDTMYGDATIFAYGIAGVRVNNNWFFINDRGEQISDVYSNIRYYKDNIFEIKKDNNWKHVVSETYNKIVNK